MPDEIEKSEQPNPDDVLAAITNFNDPSIIVGIFKELGWSYTFEIKEWLAMARQNANLSVKSKALIQLRKLLREAAETSGLIANVSQTYPNAQGGSTTFHAKRLANMLNPTKQIESTIKESQNDKTEETTDKSDRGSDRGESQRPEGIGEVHEGVSGGADTGDAFPSPEGCPGATNDSERNVGLGGTESPDGGKTSGQAGETNDDCSDNDQVGENSGSPASSDAPTENPCIKTRPPTCDRALFPGISTSAGEEVGMS